MYSTSYASASQHYFAIAILLVIASLLAIEVLSGQLGISTVRSLLSLHPFKRFQNPEVTTVSALVWQDHHLSPNSASEDERGFIATVGEFGRFTNCVIKLENSVRMSRLSGRRIFVYPLDNDMNSLSWVQVFDLDAINAMLDPSGVSSCKIQGWDTKDVRDYRVLGTSVPDQFNSQGTTCCQHGVPLILRNPTSWSQGCYLLPMFHIQALIPDDHVLAINDVQLVNIPSDWCSDQVVSRPLTLNPTDLVDAMMDPRATQTIPLAAVSGETMFFVNTDAADSAIVDLPFNADVISAANKMIDYVSLSRSEKTACFHIRREDFIGLGNFKIPYLTQWRDWALQLQRTGRAARFLIITNAAENEIAQLRRDFSDSLIGCNAKISQGCSSPIIAIAVEQQACAMTDEFFGTIESSFSRLIIRKRISSGQINRGRQLSSEMTYI